MKRLILILVVGVLPAGCSGPDTDDDPALAATLLPTPSAAAHGGLVGADSVTTRTRRIWAGSRWEMPFHISADGRRVLHADPGTDDDLAIQDLATGEYRTIMAIAELLAPEYEWVQWNSARFSPDGQRVAFWYQRVSTRHVSYPELRVVSTENEVGLGEVLIPMMPDGWGRPLRWSPDGAWILTWREAEDGRQQLMLVPVAGGEPRLLVALGYEAPTGADFSPDGRYVAYDQPATENTYAHDIHVVAVDGSGHWTLVRHEAQDLFLGWSGDGYVYFSSDRAGAPGVWRVRVREGRAAGAPELVKPDVHVRYGIGFDDHGRLYYVTRVGSREVRIASIDPVTGSFRLPATSAFPDYAASGGPAWSPDGRLLAANFALHGRGRILIRSMETGEVREIPLPPRISNVGIMGWTGDGRWLFFNARLEGRHSLLRVNVRTGAVESTAMEGLTRAIAVPGANRLLLRLRQRDETGSWGPFPRWVVYDPDTGQEPTPLDLSHPIQDLAVSPDGSTLAAALYAVEGIPGSQIRVYPMEGGEGRELVRETPPIWVGSFAFTADGSGLYYATNAEADADRPYRAIRPWIVDVSGGEPRPLDLLPWGTTRIWPHPDGRRVATVVGDPLWELWVMEDMAPVQRRGGGRGRP